MSVYEELMQDYLRDIPDRGRNQVENYAKSTPQKREKKYERQRLVPITDLDVEHQNVYSTE
jgi:hypothetical protein